MFAQEVHQQAHLALLNELAADLTRFFLRNATDRGQALGFGGKHVKGILAELLRNAGGEPRPHPAQQPGAKVLGDPPHRRRQAALKALCGKLLSVGRVRDPEAGQDDLLPQTDIGEGAGRRHLCAAL